MGRYTRPSTFQWSISCISHFRKVHINVGCAPYRGSIDKEKLKDLTAIVESILQLLNRSRQLEVFTFTFMTKGFDREFSQDLAKARSITWKSGLQAGRSYKERELDYAMKAIDLVKRECA